MIEQTDSSMDFTYLFINYIKMNLVSRATNYYRKKHNYLKRLAVTDEIIIEVQAFEPFSDNGITETEINQIEIYLENELLSQAVSLLNTEEKRLIAYKFFHNQTDGEIAKRLGVSRQAVSKTKIKILNKLGNYLKQ